jgi:hypothetical protein
MQVEPSRLVELNDRISGATPLAWVRISLCVLAGIIVAWLLIYLAESARRRVSRAPPAPPDRGPPAVDWQWQPIVCEDCRYRRSKVHVRCELGLACINDRDPARVERFFDGNPRAADDWLGHPYFVVRASAARHTSLFRLAALLGDPDETVRRAVALRAPQSMLRRMLLDPHRAVRLRVAERLAAPSLVAMLGDPDPRVRRVVARRVSARACEQLQHDPDADVRAIASERLAELRSPSPGVLREP